MSFSLGDDLHRNRDNVGTEILNKLISQMQKLNEKVEDFLVRHWVTYSPLIDLHNTSVDNTVSGVDGDLYLDQFDTFGYARYRPNPVRSYELTHAQVGGGTPTFPVTDRKFGGRMDFDGSFNLKIDDHSWLDPTDELSMGGWLYPKAFTGAEQVIISKDLQYKVVLNASANTMEVSVYISGAWGNAVTYNYTPDTWINWWMDWDGTTLELFIGGVSQDTESRSGTLNTTSNDLGIGGTPAGGSRVASGTRMAWLSLIHESVSTKTNWLTNHVAGILDTEVAEEITTFPFYCTIEPEPDAQEGHFIG